MWFERVYIPGYRYTFNDYEYYVLVHSKSSRPVGYVKDWKVFPNLTFFNETGRYGGTLQVCSKNLGSIYSNIPNLHLLLALKM